MKKEVVVRSYKRRTKDGKVITVRQHTSKYESSGATKEKGAGDELKGKKDSLPNIKYQAKYDNDEPSSQKPKRTARSKNIDEILSGNSRRSACAVKKYRHTRDSR